MNVGKSTRDTSVGTTGCSGKETSSATALNLNVQCVNYQKSQYIYMS